MGKTSEVYRNALMPVVFHETVTRGLARDGGRPELDCPARSGVVESPHSNTAPPTMLPVARLLGGAMPTPLLETKLHSPRVRPTLVSRPRLIERLDAGLSQRHRLTLISAPAGYGKTTLLSEWAAGVEWPLAWLSLDEADDDPVRFWTYVIGALRRAGQDLGQGIQVALRSPGRPTIQDLLTPLINELEASTDPLVLVLDDYHLISAPEIHDGLAFLLEHQPTRLHLVVASRADPPLPLFRLRAHGELTELRAVDLRFTQAEVTTFLNEVMKLNLTWEHASALESSTEGWAVGLQLAALSLRGRDDPDAFIADFTGSHRYVLEYLTAEVIGRQPEPVQRFLMETSVLEHLCGPLCDAVTGGEDGERLLNELCQRNLFILPLDDEGRWYRYHRLLSDLVQNLLRKEVTPGGIQKLHCRASVWYERAAMTDEAVRHALEAGDMERAADLVEENSFAVMDRGELTTVLGWLDALPGELVRSRPWLSIAYAWALMYTGRFDEVIARVEDAEQSTVEERLMGYAAAVRAYVEASNGNLSKAIAHAEQATASLPKDASMPRSFTAAILASMLRFRGDFAASARASAEAIALSRARGDSHMTVLASCNLAGTRIVQGDLRAAFETFQQTLQLAPESAASDPLPFAGLALTGLASIQREWNQLEEAERSARRGIELSERWGQAEVIIHGYVELARVLQSRGDLPGARDALERAIQVAGDLSSWSGLPLEPWAAQLKLAQGDLQAAQQWARRVEPSSEEPLVFEHMFDYLALARVLIAEGRSGHALDLLTPLLEKAAPAGAVGYVIEILTLQALAHQAQQRRDSALKRLQEALALARPQGYIRTFADEGAPVAGLLREAAARGIEPAYVGRILAATETSGRAAPLPEPLSERELEILWLLVSGLSNREIAEQLYLAVGTVKKHTHNIYGKLGVHSRTQAVARATDLGLL